MPRRIHSIVAGLAAVAFAASCQADDADREPVLAQETTDVVAPPDDFMWVGGADHGIRFAVPDDWQERETVNPALLAYLDPTGARDQFQYEAHLIASCTEMRGIGTVDQLEQWATWHFSRYHNATSEITSPGRIDLVRSEYDMEAGSGEIEHWFNYNVLAEPGWMCSITVTTPLAADERGEIEAIFDQIGPTIEPLSPDRTADG